MTKDILRRALCATLALVLLAPGVTSAQPAAQPVVTPSLPPRATVAAPPPPPSSRAMPGPDYRLGPGDLLDVQIAGRLEVIRSQVAVDLEGAINMPPIGSIPLAGLTLLEADRRIAERAHAIYKYVEVSVAVVAPRTFEITVSGEVERPGTLMVTATRRLHEVILDAGGITSRGSVRHVLVTRKSGVSEMDLLRFELKGDLTQNPFLEEGMKILVPVRGPWVSLAGAVRRPGEYEIGPDGSLAALLDLVGGLGQAAAAGEARLTRVGPDGRKGTLPLDLRTALVPPADVRLQAGDAIFVPPLSVLQDVVEVRGAFVGTPESSKTTVAGKATIVQRFELAQGDRVRDIVLRAGGAAAYADLRFAVIERSGETGPRERIPVDLRRLLVEKDETQNILLQNGDVFQLPIVEDKVYVVGEVKTPGGLDFRPDLTPREYIALAGGPTNRAKLGNTLVTFRSGQTYTMAAAPPLEPGAVVTVPEVSVKWWQDYLLIASTVAQILTAYTGLYLLFHTTSGTSGGTIF